MTVIVLNPDLTETEARSPKTSSEVEMAMRHKLKLPWKTEVTTVRDIEVPEGAVFQRGFLETVADGYSRHVGVGVAPQDIWFIVATELSKVIEENQVKLRPLFTTSDEKKAIDIMVDDPTNLTANIDTFESHLRALVPMDVSLFIPEFSTHTTASRIATMAAFMDGMKAYYSYGMFCCGLPAIKVLGTIEDWQMIVVSIGQIALQFEEHDVSITEWTSRVQMQVGKIIATLRGEDQTEWWLSIFSQKNVGSGGQKMINGWIIDFFVDNTPRMMEEFGVTFACVPFKNLHEPETKYYSVHGGFLRQKDEDGFLRTHYGDATFAIQPTDMDRPAEISLTIQRFPVS